MKKAQSLIIAGLIAVLATACHSGNVTEITTSDGVNKTHIEYSGRIIFDEAKSEIKSMQPNSYLEYEKNSESIRVKSNDRGQIMYELGGSTVTNEIDSNHKRFLAEAIQAIVKQQRGKKQ